MGLPAIVTNWSGPTAYLDDEVAYPLQYRSAWAAVRTHTGRPPRVERQGSCLPSPAQSMP